MPKRIESYTLSMDPSLYDALKTVADQKHTRVAELMRRGVQWVLLEDKVASSGGEISVQLDANSRHKVIILE
mgnify:CR=1 FL=1